MVNDLKNMLMRPKQFLFYALILFSVLSSTSCNKVTKESDSQKQGEDTVDVNSPHYQQMLKQKIADSLAKEVEKEKALAIEKKRLEKEAADRQREKGIIDERDYPQKYIDFDTEAYRKLIASKSVLNGQIRSRTKYGYYESVTIKIKYYSKNDILLGTDFFKINKMLSGEYCPFSHRIKPVKKSYRYKCEIFGAVYVPYDEHEGDLYYYGKH